MIVRTYVLWFFAFCRLQLSMKIIPLKRINTVDMVFRHKIFTWAVRNLKGHSETKPFCVLRSYTVTPLLFADLFRQHKPAPTILLIISRLLWSMTRLLCEMVGLNDESLGGIQLFSALYYTVNVLRLRWMASWRWHCR